MGLISIKRVEYFFGRHLCNKSMWVELVDSLLRFERFFPGALRFFPLTKNQYFMIQVDLISGLPSEPFCVHKQ